MEHNNMLYLTSDPNVLLDIHYRYKISVLHVTSTVNKGAYITILENFEKFCKELLFDPKILLNIVRKFLSCKGSIDKNDKYFLQGKYTAENIKGIIYTFVQKYLLCIKCDKPEVDLKYKKDKIKQKCRACGNNGYLNFCSADVLYIFKKIATQVDNIERVKHAKGKDATLPPKELEKTS
jgi:translation initiation factor 5